MSHHKLSPGTPIHVESEKPIIFLLDDPKDDPEVEEEKPKKKKKTKRNSKGTKGKDVTIKNFGAGLSISAFKQGTKLEIAWRARWFGNCQTISCFGGSMLFLFGLGIRVTKYIDRIHVSHVFPAGLSQKPLERRPCVPSGPVQSWPDPLHLESKPCVSCRIWVLAVAWHAPQMHMEPKIR